VLALFVAYEGAPADSKLDGGLPLGPSEDGAPGMDSLAVRQQAPSPPHFRLESVCLLIAELVAEPRG